MSNPTVFSIRIDQQPHGTPDPVITADQLLELAGKRPPGDWRVVVARPSGSESLRPTESVDLRNPGTEDFVTHKSDRVFAFVLNGVQHDWPAPFIEEAWLRKLAEASNDDQIWLERQGREDQLVEKEQRVDLNSAGVEQFYSAPLSIEIIVNARRKVVTKAKLSFAEVVALADGLPSGENIVYTVVYRKGPGFQPEGSLVAGQSVKIRKGMVFNVTATDKS